MDTRHLYPFLEENLIISITDTDGVITYVNDRFCKLSGYSKKEILGKKYSILKSGYHPDSFWKEMWKTILSGNTWRAEVKNKTKDENYYWVDTFIKPLVDDKGKVSEFLCMRTDITQRKELEEKLSRSEQKHKRLYNNLPAMYFTLDSSLIIRLVNDLGAQQLGYTPKELIDQSILKVFPEELHKQVSKQIDLCFSKPKKVFEWDIEKIKKDGTRITVHESAWIEQNEANGLRLNIICEDISERKRQEGLKTELYNRIKKLSENLPGFIYEFRMRPDGSTHFPFISEGVKDIYGLTPNELSENAQLLFDCIHPDDAERVSQSLGSSINKKTTEPTEFRVISKNGKTVWVRTHATVEKQPDSSVLYYGFTTDITKAKETEILLKESRDRFMNMIDKLPGYVYRVANDKDYTPIFVSKNVVNVTGYDQDEYLVHKTAFCGKEIHPDEVETVWKQVQEAIDQRQAYEIEYRIVRKDGEIRHVWEKGNGIYDDSGTLKYLEGFITDITEHREAESEKVNLINQFERISEHLPGFIYQYRIRKDGTSHFPYASKGIVDIYGITPDEVRTDASKAFEAGHPDDVERVVKSIELSAKTLTDWSDQYRVILPNGKTLWLEGHATPEKLEDESILWHGYISDITRRKKDEINLVKANRLISFTSHINEMVIHAKNRNEILTRACKIAIDHGKFRMANIGVLNKETKLFEPACVSGFDDGYLKFVRTISIKDKKTNKGPTGNALKKGTTSVNNDIADVSDHNYDVWRKEALKRGYRSSISVPIKVHEEVIGAFNLYHPEPNFFTKNEISLLEDVTSNISYGLTNHAIEEDRIKKDNALKESEERFRAMADSAPVLIWMSGTDKKYTYFNKGWLDFTGKPLKKVVEEGCVASIHADDKERFKEIYHSNFEIREPFRIEYRLKRKDGKYRWVLDNGIPRYLPGGEFVGYIGSCIDITERKKAEDRLKLQNEQLAEIAWIQSHEVRAPVASLLGLVSIFNPKNASDPVNVEVIGRIKAAAKELDVIIHKISDLTNEVDDEIHKWWQESTE